MIVIPCPCGKSLTAKPEWIGIAIRCAGCGRAHYLPEPGSAAPAPAVLDVAAEPMKACPHCRASIKAEALKCRYCGEYLDGRAAAPAAPAVRPSDEGGVSVLVVALLGWLFFCGLLSPVAWAMGSSYEAGCRARNVEPSGAGRAGKIIGIVGTAGLVLSVGFFLLVVLAGAA